MQTARKHATAMLLALMCAAAATLGDLAPQRPALAQPTTQASSQPLLPAAHTDFESSRAQVRGLGDLPAGLSAGARVADTATCEGCHADVAQAWHKSAHAFGSFNNPVYRTVIERFRTQQPLVQSQFCAGCHDIALLVDGAMQAPIAPEDPRAHAGITCRTCHGMREARPDGNASYTLDLSAVPLPKAGNAESRRQHRAHVAGGTLRTAAMCATCHRAFLSSESGNGERFLVGQDDTTPWQQSAYAGSSATRVDAEIPEQDCRGCHMPKVSATRGDLGAKNGVVASHEFLGAHTHLAAMRGDQVQHARVVREQLAPAVRVWISAVTAPNGQRSAVGGAPVPAVGESATSHVWSVDVVVKNERVGHRFPGGVGDAADTWLAVTLRDARGRELAQSGAARAAATPTQSAADDLEDAHVFAAHAAAADGHHLRERETAKFATVVFNNTIPARDAVVVRYEFDALPAGTALPVRLEAKILHRTRNLALQASACAEGKTPRGRAFAQASARWGGAALDACITQPVSELGSAAIALFAGPARTADRDFAEAFAHGQGLLHSLEERAQDAQEPLEYARSHAGSAREAAMASGALAELAARRGQRAATFAHASEVFAVLPAHPAALRAQAKVLLGQWDYVQAASMYGQAATRTPRDASLLGEWAAALAGAGAQADALSAAQAGLRWLPRDADLLRVQALAAPRAAPDPSALAAFLEARPPDDAPAVRGKCSKNVAGCATERASVHTHRLLPR